MMLCAYDRYSLIKYMEVDDRRQKWNVLHDIVNEKHRTIQSTAFLYMYKTAHTFICT